MWRWLLFRRALFTNVPLLQVLVCHFAMREMFKNMSWENTRAPGLVFSTIEMIDCIEYIVVVSPSSTRCKMSCGVCGGYEKSNVFNTIVIIWCIHLQMILDWGFLLVVETSLIPRAQRRWAKAYPINLPLLSWTTQASFGYWANHVFSNFCSMASSDLVSLYTSLTRLVVVSMHVNSYNLPLKCSFFVGHIKWNNSNLVQQCVSEVAFW